MLHIYIYDISNLRVKHYNLRQYWRHKADCYLLYFFLILWNSRFFRSVTACSLYVKLPSMWLHVSEDRNGNFRCLLVLLLALQPTMGFSLLSDFLPLCLFFTLLSPPSYSHYLHIFFNIYNLSLHWSPSNSRTYRFPLYYSLRCSLVIHPCHVI